MKRLALLLVASCAAPLAFRVDAGFPPGQVEQAAETWNARTRPDRRITLVGGEWRVARAEPTLRANGQCSRAKRLITIRPEPIGATTYDVALHEFGHALGLQHTQTGVMMATAVSVEFTTEVLAECRRVGACS